ncbi:extracellular solute-binding protein [Ornithinimicrobium cerasi]|uniref:Carbohydrate ABC transporter substrate-binding protein, CUT1 family n=1 Tax=Ornithinimicrobium cerasi TaxID=2248773 RepID=A0A285VSI5_9MICO|nr:extracellular solute-binding protein [Ornithinimicrobium cerasi]SOC57015.1 carbohydrate ABC transporter substrate-binding protein, CUT1 family [Ornithinimicrobium cerasi]
MRRIHLIVAFSASAALTLAGCGRDDGTTAGGDGDAPAQTGEAVSTEGASGELEVWAMGAEGEALPDLVAEFQDQYPDITVNVTPVPWDSAHDKFVNSITAGTTPDVAMVGTTWMGEFAGMDALDPTPGSIDAGKFFEGAQDTTVVDGTSYGVPWYVETRMVYYRTDVAQEAGFDEVPADQAGFKEMAAALKDAGAEYGISLQPGQTGSWQTVLPFAWSHGAEIASEEGYTFNTTEMVESVEYYGSFFAEEIANANPPEGQTEADFTSGNVPMFISGPWMMSIVEDFAANEGEDGFAEMYDVAPIPAGASGESSSFIGGSNLAVFQNTESRDAAWALVDWLTQPETQVKWYEMTSALPSVQEAWEDDALTADDKLAKFGEELQTAQAPPSFPSWEQVAEAFDGEIEKVAKQGLSAQEAMDAAQAQADSIGTGQ